MGKPPTLGPAMQAAYQHVNTMVPQADDPVSIMWHGWALRESFLAGVKWARAHTKKKNRAASRRKRAAAKEASK